MTKFFHLAKRKGNTVKKKRKIFNLSKINFNTVNVVIGVMIVVMGVTYLVQINGLVTKGYQISELEQKITELTDRNADLELETLSLQSMDSIKTKVDGLGLVAVGEVEYLNPTPVAVAR